MIGESEDPDRENVMRIRVVGCRVVALSVRGCYPSCLNLSNMIGSRIKRL